MKRAAPRVVICGGGVAGLACAHALLQRGCEVDVVFRDPFEGSSFTNQKWRHSGVLYETPELVNEVWDAYRGMDPLLELPFLTGAPHARFMASDPDLLDQHEARWQAWDIARKGLIARRFSLRSGYREGSLGTTPWIGGFLTPDRVMDYPSLISHLLRVVTQMGGRLHAGSSVTDLIEENGEARGVRFQSPQGREERLSADQVVVTLGAWTNTFLARAGLHVPVSLVKSNVLAYPGELVPSITLWLGDQVTLVPYQGTTLIADHRWVDVEDPRDRSPHAENVARLVDDLKRTFSQWPDLPFQARGCIKTEEIVVGPYPRNPNMAIFEASRVGMPGLTVAFPGKASLVFVMARRVADAVLSGHKKTGVPVGNTPVLL